MKSYVGVGSRKTPARILSRMTGIGVLLGERGICLRSGGAQGADQAFERGCDSSKGPKEIYLPFEGYQHRSSDEPGCHERGTCGPAREIAESLHPAWHRCSERSRQHHTRNVYQILGLELDDPVKLLVCWTHEGRALGGTATAIWLAQRHRVPVFNLATKLWTLKQMLKHTIDRRTP